MVLEYILGSIREESSRPYIVLSSAKYFFPLCFLFTRDTTRI